MFKKYMSLTLIVLLNLAFCSTVTASTETDAKFFRIYDRKSGTIIAAGETTSWGSLAENLARHISKKLVAATD